MINSKNILLTGGGGFIGSHVHNRLVELGCAVVTVSRSCSSDSRLSSLDLSKKSDVVKFIERTGPFDVIIHCAAIAHGERPPAGTTISEFNSTMVANLVHAFGDCQPHWIFTSSVSVYGHPRDEISNPIVLNPVALENYGQGKLYDELLLIKVCDTLDILRLTPTYDSQHLNDIKKRVFIPTTNIKLKIFPAPYYTFCHVKTAGDKILECLRSGQGKNLHQVGDLKSISQHDLVNRFNGISIVVPKQFFRLLNSVLPSNISGCSALKILLRKLGFNNVFEIGVKKL